MRRRSSAGRGRVALLRLDMVSVRPSPQGKRLSFGSTERRMAITCGPGFPRDERRGALHPVTGAGRPNACPTGTSRRARAGVAPSLRRCRTRSLSPRGQRRSTGNKGVARGDGSGHRDLSRRMELAIRGLRREAASARKPTQHRHAPRPCHDLASNLALGGFRRCQQAGMQDRRQPNVLVWPFEAALGAREGGPLVSAGTAEWRWTVSSSFFWR